MDKAFRGQVVVAGPDWSCLPPELLEHIFQYLYVQAKGRAARVCVNWRNASYNKSVWKDDVITWSKKIDVAVNTTLVPSLVTRGITRAKLWQVTILPDMVRDFPNVRGLKCNSYRHEGTISDAIDTISTMTNFTELTLEQYDSLTDREVQLISGNLSELMLLSISHCGYFSDGAILAISRGLKKLKHLRLTLMEKITDKGIAYLTGCNPDVVTSPPSQLHYLNMHDCPLLTNTAMLYLSIGQPELRHLDVAHSRITSVGVKHLTALEQLDVLNILNYQIIDRDALRHLASMPQLRQLHLAFGIFRGAGLEALAADPAVSGITSLNLKFCRGVSDYDLKSLAKMANLRALNLTNWRITDAGLASLAQGASKITSLTVMACTNVTDEGLRQLSKMSHLTVLNIGHCVNVTWRGLVALGNGRAQITKLRVNGCSKILVSHSESFYMILPHLRYLEKNHLFIF